MSFTRHLSPTTRALVGLLLLGCAPDEGLFGNSSGVGGGLAATGPSSGTGSSASTSGGGAGTSVGSGGGGGGSVSSVGSGGAGGASSVATASSSGTGGASSVGPGGGEGGGQGTGASGPGAGGGGGLGPGGAGSGGGAACDRPADCGEDSACVAFACVAGSCSTSFAPAGTACDGQGVCDGAGDCVGCLGPDDCESGFCEDQTCQPCGDGQDCVSGRCACQVCVAQAGLFISEYVEGSLSNKAIELFNPTDDAIDLEAEGCEIFLYANGSDEPNDGEPIEGTIEPGDTRSICLVGAAFGLSCDQLTLNLGFNGNDAVALVCGGVTIDVVGRIGEDPGIEWGMSLTSTADNTLIRRPGVLVGDPDGTDPFDPSIEWIGRPSNDTDDLNDHTLCP